MHRIGVPIRVRTERQRTIAEEVIASAENLLGTREGVLTCGRERAQDDCDQIRELSCVDREHGWPAGEVAPKREVRCAEVLTFERFANRRPARRRNLRGQRGDERRSSPLRREGRRANASFELSRFTQCPEAQFLRRHRDEPAEDLSRHTGRVLGSDSGSRGAVMFSYSASHRDRTTFHWYS